MRNYILWVSEFATVYIGIFLVGTVLFLAVVIYCFQLKTIYLEADINIFSDLSFFYKKQNLFFLSPEQVGAQMQLLYPGIKEVTIKKNFPSSLYIKVVERSPLATIIVENKPALIDLNGVVLPKLRHFSSENLPRVECPLTINNNRIANQDLLGALRILDAVHTDRLIIAHTLRCDESGRMSLLTSTTEIIFSSGQEPRKVVASLQFLTKQFTINASWPKRIDLSFDKIVIIP